MASWDCHVCGGSGTVEVIEISIEINVFERNCTECDGSGTLSTYVK